MLYKRVCIQSSAFARPLNLAAMSHLRSGVKSQNRKCCNSGVSDVFFLNQVLQVEETTVKEMDNRKATPRDNVLLKIFKGAPISRWLTNGTDRNKCPMFRLFYVISMQQFLR